MLGNVLFQRAQYRNHKYICIYLPCLKVISLDEFQMKMKRQAKMRYRYSTEM